MTSPARFARLAAALLITGLTTAQPAQAEVSTPTFEETQALLAQVQTDRRALVLRAMRLDDTQARAFTPIYDRYQLDQKDLMQRAVDLLTTYASNYESMTDDAAEKLTKRWFALQQDELELVEDYSKQLDRVLPATRVLRFIQIENKLNTLQRFATVRNIPLAR